MELLLILIIFCISITVGLLIKHRAGIEWASIIASASAFVGSNIIALKVASTGIYAPFLFFYVDSLGAILMLIISLVGFVTTIYSVQYLRQETIKQIIGFRRVRQFFILLNIFFAAMFLSISASSPIFTWVFI